MIERLKLVRTQQGMTQSQFAEVLGTSRTAYAKYENGIVTPSDTFIRLLCEKFGINEQWLRTGEGDPKAPSSEDLLEEVARQYDLSPLQKEVLQNIMSIPSDVREKLAKAYFAVLDARAAGETVDGDRAAAIDRKKAIINEEMEARKGAPTSPASTNTSGNTAGGRK